MNMKLTLDIGGSKTRGYILGNGEKIGFEIPGGFGIAEDKNGVCKPLVKALKKQFGRGRYAVNAVAINLGGKNKEQIKRSAEAAFPKANVAIYRESEGALALEILRLYQADILVMAGTGCISFAKNDEKSIVYGGWGKDFSDEGSGYYIGSLAIRRALKELDSQKQEFSLLAKEITGEEQPFPFQSVQSYPTARDLVRSRLPKTREGVAAITKTVVKCAEQGCGVALEILKENALEIKKTIQLLSKVIKKDRPKVIINGGVTNSKALWENELNDIGEILYINDGIDFALKTIVENM